MRRLEEEYPFKQFERFGDALTRRVFSGTVLPTSFPKLADGLAVAGLADSDIYICYSLTDMVALIQGCAATGKSLDWWTIELDEPEQSDVTDAIVIVVGDNNDFHKWTSIYDGDPSQVDIIQIVTRDGGSVEQFFSAQDVIDPWTYTVELCMHRKVRDSLRHDAGWGNRLVSNEAPGATGLRKLATLFGKPIHYYSGPRLGRITFRAIFNPELAAVDA